MIFEKVKKSDVVLDQPDEPYFDKRDIQVNLTYVEHEVIQDILVNAVDTLNSVFPYGLHDLPIDNEIVQRYTTIQNLRERFNALWDDRFNTDKKDEIL